MPISHSGALATNPLLTEIIESSDLSELVSQRIFEGTPHVFEGDREALVGWKTKLGSMLSIDPYSMIVVGSAALGFSLNPRKELAKPFSGDSDVDVAILSPRYFDEAWIALREMRSDLTFLSAEAKYAIKRHREEGLLFDGAIATDRFLQYLPFGPEWVKALAEMANHPKTLHHDVNARLYRDIDSLRRYQTKGLAQARQRLIEASATEEGGT